MIKLFVTLNVLLFGAVFLYLFNSQSIGEAIISKPKEVLYENSGKGTLYLLNQSVAGLSPAQREAKLTVLKAQFPYPLDLQKLDVTAFSDYQLKRLKSGLIESKEIDRAEHFYGLLPGTDLVWDIAVDLSNEQDMRNSWAGTFYLIEQTLLKHEPSRRVEAMKQLQTQFGLEVALLKQTDLTLTASQKEQLSRGLIVVDNLGNDEKETFYKKMPDSDSVIFIGSIPYPWIKNLITPLMLSLLLLVMALATFFWVWTLWKDITRIRKAAERFGQGEHDERVSYKKTDRLAPLSRAFNQMAEQTQNSIRSHKELTSAVSHELRTPVARMRFSLDMLEVSDNQQDRQRYVDNMNTDMNELDLLLKELLTIARFDQNANPLNLQTVSLRGWMDKTVDSLRSLSAGKTLDIAYRDIMDSRLVCFDPTLMSRLLSNLVQNALRYAHSRVLVSVSETTEGIQICVDDDGEGIPEADRAKLFDAFATRDDSRNKSAEGFGLGLAIVSRITDAHQGTVQIQDSPLGGARFCVCWPKKLAVNTDKAA